MAKKRRKTSVTTSMRKRKQPRAKAPARTRARKRAVTRGRTRPVTRARKRTATPHRARPTPRRRIVRKRAQPKRRLEIRAVATDDLTLGQKVPNLSERDVVGAGTTRIVRGTPEFAALISNTNPQIVFKDEEGTAADRMMTTRLAARLDALANSVAQAWTGVKLRVTEAWDENIEHGTNSVHYEARGADLTTSPIDGGKLGRLGRLAVNAGLEWVFFEDARHIHVSMAK
jgi:Hedgehog amino-terminal signalling domain